MTAVRLFTRISAIAAAFHAWAICLLLLLVTAPALAGSITLAWDPPLGHVARGLQGLLRTYRRQLHIEPRRR